MKENTKETYLTPVTTVFGLESKSGILIDSGRLDPLYPPDI